ncbi:hypothetical protein ACFVUS_09860 [Nocardia sp. NPDC058058]|uniref:hypothetical protein n=1 Tax=Nocardia sp. NPDC058058 TaxID=3346317 RepID=UPI0036DF60ED
MTVRNPGQQQNGRYVQPPRPKRSLWARITRFGILPVLLFLVLLIFLPLILLAALIFLQPRHDPTVPAAPSNGVSVTQQSPITSAQTCYPFQLDCTPR